MAHFDTKFDPRVMQLTKPDGNNMLNAFGSTLTGVLQQQKKDYLDSIKLQDIEAKHRDEKKLVKQINKGKADMETLSGATMAAKLRAPKPVKKAGRVTRGRRGVGGSADMAPASPSALAQYNARLIPTNSTAPSVPKTMTVYQNGKPVTVQIKG